VLLNLRNRVILADWRQRRSFAAWQQEKIMREMPMPAFLPVATGLLLSLR
jgi:hypothetical protein